MCSEWNPRRISKARTCMYCIYKYSFQAIRLNHMLIKWEKFVNGFCLHRAEIQWDVAQAQRRNVPEHNKYTVYELSFKRMSVSCSPFSPCGHCTTKNARHMKIIYENLKAFVTFSVSRKMASKEWVQWIWDPVGRGLARATAPIQ